MLTERGVDVGKNQDRLPGAGRAPVLQGKPADERRGVAEPQSAGSLGPAGANQPQPSRPAAVVGEAPARRAPAAHLAGSRAGPAGQQDLAQPADAGDLGAAGAQGAAGASPEPRGEGAAAGRARGRALPPAAEDAGEAGERRAAGGRDCRALPEPRSPIPPAGPSPDIWGTLHPRWGTPVHRVNENAALGPAYPAPQTTFLQRGEEWVLAGLLS